MKNLLISFSGGETSAFMAQWMKKNYKKFGYENIVFVFANTGLENEETLEFVDKCDTFFDLKINWVEALVWQTIRKSSTYQIKDFLTASRKGQPFEDVIKKYGIPNMSHPHCTRELKQNPIKAFGKVYFNGEKYHTAIGIRSDEIDRINEKKGENGLIYPLIQSEMIPSTKQKINSYWKLMPFRLKLKGYQGNCITCWKKSDYKLFQIAKENKKSFDFMIDMENKYGRIGAEFDKNDSHISNRVFFRGNRSASEILEQSKFFNKTIKDDSKNYEIQQELFGNDSCEIFSNCSDL